MMLNDLKDYQLFISFADISDSLQLAFKNAGLDLQATYTIGFEDAILEVCRLRIEALGIEKKGEEK